MAPSRSSSLGSDSTSLSTTSTCITVPEKNECPMNYQLDEGTTQREIQQYHLPPIVEAIRQSWIVTAQYITLFTVILAAIHAILLSNSRGTENTTSAASRATRIFSFAGLFLNLGAAFSGVSMLDNLGTLSLDAREKCFQMDSLPRRVLQKEPIPKELLVRSGQSELLVQFGIDRSWGASVNHLFICFFLGSICPFILIGIQVWETEGPVVAGPVTIFLALGLTGILIPIFSSFHDVAREPSCSNEQRRTGASV